MGRLRPLAEARRIRDDMVAALRPDMVAFDLQNEPTDTCDDALQNEPTDTCDDALQNEPTGGDAGRDSRIEPTDDNAAHVPQDQSTADFPDQPNEPASFDVYHLQNEPTDDGGG